MNNLSPSHLIGTRIHKKVENANKISCVVKMYTDTAIILKPKGVRRATCSVFKNESYSAIGPVWKDRK